MRRLEAKGLARAKLRARRQRARTIRRRTIRGSLALFAVLWAIVFAQLVSGNDPALSSALRSRPRRATARKHEPVSGSEFEDEDEAPLPEGEFAPEAEPEEELVPAEESIEPEPPPIVTASS
jgi:hypothetical protein